MKQLCMRSSVTTTQRLSMTKSAALLGRQCRLAVSECLRRACGTAVPAPRSGVLLWPPPRSAALAWRGPARRGPRDCRGCGPPTPSSASSTPGRRGAGAGLRPLLQLHRGRRAGAGRRQHDRGRQRGERLVRAHDLRGALGRGARGLRGAPLVLGIAVAGPASTTSPCGACRQVLREFGGTSLPVTFPHAGGLVTMTIDELLPAGFVLRRLRWRGRGRGRPAGEGDPGFRSAVIALAGRPTWASRRS